MNKYSCVDKIPFFKGASHASRRLASIAEFANAKVVKVNPSQAQMSLR